LIVWLTVAIPTSVTAIQKPARVRRWVRTQRVRVVIIIESLLAAESRESSPHQDCYYSGRKYTVAELIASANISCP